MRLILTCEHATNLVPTKYKNLFADAQDVLSSHRGWDPGSLSLGKTMQRDLAAPLFQTEATRLLVDPNRSIGHRNLYSPYTANLDNESKRTILDVYYLPHRTRVETWIGDQIQSGQLVLHVSIHTFASELHGEIRNTDVGLLYDPARAEETAFCRQWRSRIATTSLDVSVRRNYPYLGKADGFTTYLRKRFPDERYLGIELEVNQCYVNQPPVWKRLVAKLSESLGGAMAK